MAAIESLDVTEPKPMINLVIADQDAIYQLGCVNSLSAENDIRVMGQLQNLEQLLDKPYRSRVHVLMMSAFFLPSLSTIQSLTAYRSTSILAVVENGEEASACLAMGIDGVAYRSVSAAALVHAVRRLALGMSFVDNPTQSATDVSDDVVGTKVRDGLSNEELRIIACVLRGYTNREIAALMYSTEQRIKNALCVIFDKIGVWDRLELSLFVLHHGVLARATTLAPHERPLQPGVHSSRHTLRTGSPVSHCLERIGVVSQAHARQRRVKPV
jgi:DNA-binding NarL/FixJ family response regulator